MKEHLGMKKNNNNKGVYSRRAKYSYRQTSNITPGIEKKNWKPNK